MGPVCCHTSPANFPLKRKASLHPPLLADTCFLPFFKSLASNLRPWSMSDLRLCTQVWQPLCLNFCLPICMVLLTVQSYHCGLSYWLKFGLTWYTVFHFSTLASVLVSRLSPLTGNCSLLTRPLTLCGSFSFNASVLVIPSIVLWISCRYQDSWCLMDVQYYNWMLQEVLQLLWTLLFLIQGGHRVEFFVLFFCRCYCLFGMCTCVCVCVCVCLGFSRLISAFILQRRENWRARSSWLFRYLASGYQRQTVAAWLCSSVFFKAYSWCPAERIIPESSCHPLLLPLSFCSLAACPCAFPSILPRT